MSKRLEEIMHEIAPNYTYLDDSQCMIVCKQYGRELLAKAAENCHQTYLNAPDFWPPFLHIEQAIESTEL